MPRRRGEARTPLVLVSFYLIILLVVLLDQITKFLAQINLADISTVPVIPHIFHLTLVYNPGIAFGFFREHPLFLLALISLSLAVLFFMSRGVRQLPGLAQWGFGLILGGAIGNWIDRMRLGYVIDFLDFRVWPVFNIADTAISVGVGLYLLSLLKQTKKSL